MKFMYPAIILTFAFINFPKHIFASKNCIDSIDNYILSLSTSSLQEDSCSTCIIINPNLLRINMKNIPWILYNYNTDSNDNITSYHNVYYMDMEWTDDDFKINWIKIKHGRQCALGFITLNDTENTIRETNELLYLKLMRPSMDYFVFIGQNENQLNSFLFDANLVFIQDLKFKYGLALSSDTRSKPFSLISPCGSSLFSNECKSVMNGKRFVVFGVFGPQMLRVLEGFKKGSMNTNGAGVYYEVLLGASEAYNFTFEIKQLAGFRGASGFKRNGTWYGALGELFKREVDVVITAGITEQRYHIADPTCTMCWVHRIFFIRKSMLGTKWTAIFKPLDSFVWSLVFLLTFISVPIYYYSLIPSNQLRDKSCSGILLEWITKSSVFYRMILEQDWNEHGHQTGLKLRYLVTIWAIFCLVLTTSYRSKLMNFLTFLTSEPVPETHSALIQENYVLYFRYYGGVAYEYYRTSKLQTHQEIVKRAILMNTSFDCMIAAATTDKSACLDYNFHGHYAVLTNVTLYAHHTTSSDASNNNAAELFIRSTDFTTPVPIPFCLRKGSPLLSYFDSFILKALAFGLHDHWMAQDWDKGRTEGAKWMQSLNHSMIKERLEDTFQNLQSTTRALNIQSLVGLGFLLAGGSGIALVVWVGEMMKSVCARPRHGENRRKHKK